MRTLIFDFGNVLAHFDHMRAVRRLVRFTDLPADELFHKLYHNELEDDYEHGKIGTDEYVRQGLDRGRLTCSSEQFLIAFVDIFTPNPDVCELVPKLVPTYRLVLASNTNAAHFAEYSRAFADTLRHFAAVVTSHEAGHRKPAAGFYEYAQRFVAAEPGECLFVDDLDVNVAAGERHGWRGVVYRPGDRIADKLRAAGVQVGGGGL